MFTSASSRALIMSLIAGMSTLVGAFIIFIFKNKNEKVLSVSLGFAGGVLISVSLSDLFPAAHRLIDTAIHHPWGAIVTIGSLAVGIILAAILDIYVHEGARGINSNADPHKNLFRVGLVSMLAIGLHNFPEGIATFMASYKDISLGLSVVVAISLHNIPEGISIAAPIYYASKSKGKAFRYTFYSAIAEPTGALLAFLLLRPFLSDVLLGIMFAVVAGIMIYIAIEELIPSSRQYGYDRQALIATFAGICLMPLTFFF
jgi:ZIP family zinc transporter